MPSLKEQAQLTLNEMKNSPQPNQKDIAFETLVFHSLIDEYGEDAVYDEKMADARNKRIGEFDEAGLFKTKFEETGKRDPQKYADIAEDPNGFYEEYKGAKGVFDKLMQFEENKDYNGLVNYITDACYYGALGDPESKAVMENGAVIEYFKTLSKADEQGQISPTRKDAALGISDAISSMTADLAVQGLDRTKEWTKRVRSGEFPETRFVKDDPKTAEKIGRVLMFYQDPVGRRLQALDSVFSIFANGLTLGYDKITPKVGEEIITAYVDKKRFRAYFDKYQEVFHEEPAKDKTDEADRLDAIREAYVAPTAGVADGFEVRKEPAKPGESCFDKMPSFHKQLFEMSDDELLKSEYDSKEHRRLVSQSKQRLKEMIPPAQSLLDELDEADEEEKQTDAYIRMRAELENFTKLDKAGFVSLGDILDGSVIARSAGMNINRAKVALSRLDEEAARYAEADPDFAYKVQSFVWEQKAVYKKELGSEAKKLEGRSISEAKLIASEKAFRQIGDMQFYEGSLIPEKETALDEKLAAAKNKYNRGKLFARGSREYDNVGTALETLETKLSELHQMEELRNINTDSDREYKQALLSLKRFVREMRETDKKYFEHKKADGQWGPENPNDNAKKRVNAVMDIHEMTGELDELIDMKLRVLDNTVVADYAPIGERIRVNEPLTADEKKPSYKRVKAEPLNALDRIPGSTVSYQNGVRRLAGKINANEINLLIGRQFNDAKKQMIEYGIGIIATKQVFPGKETRTVNQIADEVGILYGEADKQAYLEDYESKTAQRDDVIEQLKDDDVIGMIGERIDSPEKLKLFADMAVTGNGQVLADFYEGAKNNMIDPDIIFGMASSAKEEDDIDLGAFFNMVPEGFENEQVIEEINVQPEAENIEQEKIEPEIAEYKSEVKTEKQEFLGSVDKYQIRIKEEIENPAPKTNEEFLARKEAVMKEFAGIIATRTIIPEIADRSVQEVYNEYIAENDPDGAEEFMGECAEKMTACDEMQKMILNEDPSFAYMSGKINTWDELQRVSKNALTKDGNGLMIEYSNVNDEYISMNAQAKNEQDPNILDISRRPGDPLII